MCKNGSWWHLWSHCWHFARASSEPNRCKNGHEYAGSSVRFWHYKCCQCNVDSKCEEDYYS